MMKVLGIKAMIKRKRPTYVKATEVHVAENILNRKVIAEKPNQKWCTDITEFEIWEWPKGLFECHHRSL